MDYITWQKYWRKALIAAWWLRFVPYVRLIGLNGSMATGSVHAESDIDFYIVTAPNHIFFTRALTTLLVHVLGMRRHGNYVAGRVCLNRYATTEFTEITPHDSYHARVFHNLIPLAAMPSVYGEYCRQNAWMANYGYSVRIHKTVMNIPLIQRLGEWLLWPIAGFAEKFCQRWQENRAKHDARVSLPKSIVVLTQKELRFHLQKEV